MNPPITYASLLGPCIARYIELKQTLGRQYTREHYILRHLDAFLATQDADCTADAFGAWCATLSHLTPGVRRAWMQIVRNLCLYRQRSEPSCFVPDPRGFPSPHRAARPHLFTREEIIRALRTIEELPPSPASPLRREVFRLAIVLLYTAGLRRREVVGLTLGDYDFVERTLTIRASKFHKSRLVPLSATAANEMEAYFVKRQHYSSDSDDPLLYHPCRPLPCYTGAGLARGLRDIFRRADIRTASGRLPRVHDLRHSFAHEALLRWYRAGVDVQAKLPALATYMGHVSVVSTYYYLSMFEPFAEAASERFARHCRPFIDEAYAGDAP
ncbi:tyrosine-type recombinase/integrase [Halomonas sp. 25-S5]|uniref:tyrosine-type recombinase/integrase n=1 Tax=Halomonas sp. 25-S5 TaxID=2994065 RepID=UPI002468DDD1|nr:tyrosine-type recombinase/integrase [Halomonas sp. 25-S5]